MPRLILLRHAKSDWSNPALDDFDRPLNRRGEKAAPRVGRYLRKESLIPDRVLCSAARRARETWGLVGEELRAEVPVKYLRSLYLASPSRLLETLQRVNDGVGLLMLVGHNPGMENLAALLVGSGGPKIRERMLKKFPTAALAVIRFQGRSWDGLRPGAGLLEQFIVPKELE